MMALNNSIVWLKSIVYGAYWTIPNKHYDIGFMRTFFFFWPNRKCKLDYFFQVLINNTTEQSFFWYNNKLNIDLFIELVIAKTEILQLFVCIYIYMPFEYILYVEIHQEKK